MNTYCVEFMANKNKINLPQSGAGITSYFEGSSSKIEIQPMHVVWMIIVVVLFVIAISVLGPQPELVPLFFLTKFIPSNTKK